METVYKLTDRDSKTRPRFYNETQWGPNVTHTAPGEGGMCSAGWIHAYSHPLLAVLLNPAHASYEPFQLWRCDAEVGIRQADKLGCTKLTTVEQIAAPKITPAQRVAFAIYVALRVHKNKKLVWAENWLSGKDRSTSADAAYDAAAAAAYDAAAAAASDAAAAAAYGAAYTATLAKNADDAAAHAAAAATAAVAAAATAAVAANLTDKDLLQFAEKALQEV